MKRLREAPSNTPSPSDNTNVITQRPPPKRAKASQACTSCRKHKTRCELLESLSYLSRCHRCDVLSITCSFETNAPQNSVVDNSPVTTCRQRLLRTILSVPEPNPDRCLEPTQSEINGSTLRPTVTSAWEFLKVPGIPDWTATPMLAMLTLSKMASESQTTIQPTANLTFTEVLTGDQIQYLLGVFESSYAPWLSLPPDAPKADPVLDLVRCTIASRHLESSIRASVFPALRRLTEEAIMKHVFSPTPSPAIIQAFALLALWSPFDTFSPSSSETHDSRLIAASAINMCISLRFDQAVADEHVLNERRKLGAELSFQEAALLTAAEQKWFLWMCVHNIESTVCIGTGRGISSKTPDFTLRSLAPLNFSTLANARRTRMLLSTRIFGLTEAALRLEMSEDHRKFESFCDESAEMLYRFDGMQRVITSVHVVTDIEVFYAHMLIVYFYFCRLAFVIHILRHMRIQLPRSIAARGGNVLSSSKITRTGSGFALICGVDALASAEALLTAILSVKDNEHLATAPDSVYAMISFAAGYITTAKLLMLQSKTMRQLPGASDELLARTIKCLRQVSLSTDDNASRCARVISGFVDTWHERLNAHNTEAMGENVDEPGDSPQGASSTSSASKTRSYAYTNSESTLEEPSPDTIASPNGFDYLFNLDQDTILGPEFWQHLTEMPNIQPDIEPTYGQ
ncbi:hypothetical protein BJV78DRAFT_872379 [Lactifluus subvellereus]|nr:hypothetical protein BJV78DRAFT_872379 [Lactifluus subvellereus]